MDNSKTNDVPVMDKIYEQAKDLHVKNFIAYGKAADHKLYYESAYTTQVTQADLEDAFKKGILIIKDSTTFLFPISLAANKVKTVTATTVGETTTVSLVEWTAAAAE